jgi:hypothetical protein
MFMIGWSGEYRRPLDWERPEAEDDCRFIPENRRWTQTSASTSKAIGLYDIIPSDSTESANERWLKRWAPDGGLTLTADLD